MSNNETRPLVGFCPVCLRPMIAKVRAGKSGPPVVVHHGRGKRCSGVGQAALHVMEVTA